MGIGSNISKVNNIGINHYIKQKENSAENNKSMPKQTYAAYPSGQLLKAMFVGEKKIDEQTQNIDKIKNTSFADKLEDYEIDALSGMMKSDNKNSKAVNGLIDLIESGLVPNHTIYYSSKHSDIQPNIANDIELMQQAKATGTPIEDLIVPKFETAEDARKNAKTGDVYNIGDENNVYIKTDDENSKQLKFDKETYLKLFPPVERFCTFQSRIGDCYLISMLDTLYHNPETRVKILDCFEQDGKDVKAKLPNKDVSFVAKDCKLFDKTEDNPQKGIYNRGAEGLKILEHLYGDFRVQKSIEDAKTQTYKKIDNTFFEQLDYEDDKRFYTDAKQGSNDRIAHAKAELDYLQNGGNIPKSAGFSREDRITMLKETIADDEISIKEYNKQLQTEEPDTDKKMGRQLKRKDQLLETAKNPENFWAERNLSKTKVYKNDDDSFLNCVFTFEEDEDGVILDGMKEKLQAQNKNYLNVGAMFREAGYQDEIFKAFDMAAYKIFTKDENFESKLKEQMSQGVIFAAASKAEIENENKMTQDYNIVSSHAYGATPYVDDNDKIRIKVVNPWSTTFSTDLSLEEFQNNFSRLIYAKK